MTDTTLRDRIAQALHRDQTPPPVVSWVEEQPLDREYFLRRADAVLAVLPPPADRAAVLREAADRIDAGWFTTAATATAELRRMAAEAQPATEAEVIRREHVDYFLQCQQPDGTWEQASSYETDPDRAQERLARLTEKHPEITWRLARRTTTVLVEVQDPAQP
ncbi:hypothetical protein ACF1AL_14700 [Streptomyces sp. NPDC014801]|uniref:hypothetical protein n=1 Tax=Streptomyces sp. NPDC014801 TaxID=3364916 RepID=UPI0036FE7A80